MFLISKTGSLVQIRDGKAYMVYPECCEVVNTDGGCIFSCRSGVFDHSGKKIADPGDLYKTVDGRIMVETNAYRPYIRYAIFDLVYGRIVYFEWNFCIFRGESYFAVFNGDRFPLMPANRHVTFVDRLTPVSDDIYNLDIHTIVADDNRIAVEVWRLLGRECILVHSLEYFVDREIGDCKYFTWYRNATYVLCDVIYAFKHHDNGIRMFDVEPYRVCDKYIICEKNKVLDMTNKLRQVS